MGNPFLAWPFSAFEPRIDLGEPALGIDNANLPAIQRAIQWRNLLDTNAALTTREIADSQQITPGRVRQILRLATLQPEIVEALLAMDSVDLKLFGENRLRRLVSLSRQEQLERFEAMTVRT